MNNKKYEPFGCFFFLVTIVAVIIGYIVAYKNKLGSMDSFYLVKWLVAIVWGVYGIVDYFIKKFRK